MSDPTPAEIDGSGTGTVRGVPFPPGASGSAAPHALLLTSVRMTAEAPALPMAAVSRTAVPTEINVDWPGPATPAAPDRKVVVVHRGDTLWAIAARHLPGRPTDIQIDHAWRAWYAANRDVVGPDPNLILPGQQLWPPTTDSDGAS